MKKLEKIVSLLLRIVELLPILIEFLKALDRDTNVIKSKLDSLDFHQFDKSKLDSLDFHQFDEDIKQVTEVKQFTNSNETLE